MSSLLDVLHKRPPRSQTAATESVVAAEPADEAAPDSGEAAQDTGAIGAGSPATDFRLAPDLELAAGTMTLRHASLGEDGTMRVRRPESPTPGYERADAAQTRRWADPSTEVQAPRPALNEPAMRRSRLPLIYGALALVVAACGYAGWQFMTPDDDSIIVDQSVTGLAATGDRHPVAAPGQPSAASVAPARNPGVDGAPGDGSVSGKGDVAWYDQPALPAAADARSTPSIEIVRNSVENPVYPRLRAAYDALRAGDAAKSESLYREVLTADPNNVDALLGLGSLATRGGRPDEARDAYSKALQLDPKNASAVAALSALPGAGSQANEESRLKSMLQEQPSSAELYFALGLRYVAGQRWADAQTVFFEAVRNDPTNADYAFNLAVSLDQLGQVQAAASYYQRAIELASGSHGFDVDIARARLTALRVAPG